MVERRDTGVTRHAGGWIVLSGGLLLTCLWSAPSAFRPPAEGLPSEAQPAGQQSAIPAADQLDHPATRFPKLSIDINQADAAELSCIEGIGPALAARILEARGRYGRFTRFDQLESISGIGPRMAERLRAAIEPLEETVDDPHRQLLAPTHTAELPEGSIEKRTLANTDTHR